MTIETEGQRANGGEVLDLPTISVPDHLANVTHET